MICLGIESTAHTFGVGIMDNSAKVFANVKHMYTTTSGGIIPTDAGNHHVEFCDVVLLEALEKAKLKISEIDLISFSQGPGMGHTLRVGAMLSRSLHTLYNIPMVGVNHCVAHLEIGRALTHAK